MLRHSVVAPPRFPPSENPLGIGTITKNTLDSMEILVTADQIEQLVSAAHTATGTVHEALAFPPPECLRTTDHSQEDAFPDAFGELSSGQVVETLAHLAGAALQVNLSVKNVVQHQELTFG